MQTFKDPAFGGTYGPSKAGKCLTGSSEILLADGRVERLDALVATKGYPQVVALDGNHKLVVASVSAFFSNGPKPVVRVETRDGRAITVTRNHPLLTQRGWVHAGDLTPDDLLAVPRALPFFGGVDEAEGKVKYLAYHLADGTFDNGALRLTTSSPEKLADLQSALAAAFPDVETRQDTIRGEPGITYCIARKAKDRRTSSAHAFLRDLGLDGARAAAKCVPACVFTWRRPLVALFLSRYLGCDGAVHADGQVSFSSASERMARQMSHLLLRFGVFGRLRTKVVNSINYYEWVASDAGAVEALRREVGVFTKPIMAREVGPSKHDRLPVKWSEIPTEHRARPSWRRGASYITRDMGQRMFDVGEALHKLAHSDLRWEPVFNLTDAGVEPTFDLTVPVHHTFVANDVVAHNSTDNIYSFPGAFFLAPPGALKPSVNVVGYDIPPQHIYDPKSVPDAAAKLKEIARTGKFKVAVVDDFSMLCELSFALLEQSRGLTGWKLWGALSDEVLDFRDTARRLGIHVFVNMHERAPSMTSGTAQRGGPKLPGKLPESFPAACDIILRAAPGASTFGTKMGWANVYRCNPTDPTYVTGDRHGVTPDNAPMNLAEILRAAGYEIPRAPGLEWMERAVEIVADVLLKGGPSMDNASMQQAAPWLVQQMIVLPYYAAVASTLEGQRRIGLHARWVMRDAYDRTVLLRARMNPLALFGITG